MLFRKYFLTLLTLIPTVSLSHAGHEHGTLTSAIVHTTLIGIGIICFYALFKKTNTKTNPVNRRTK